MSYYREPPKDLKKWWEDLQEQVAYYRDYFKGGKGLFGVDPMQIGKPTSARITQPGVNTVFGQGASGAYGKFQNLIMPLWKGKK